MQYWLYFAIKQLTTPDIVRNKQVDDKKQYCCRNIKINETLTQTTENFTQENK